MFSADDLVKNAPGKGCDFSGRNECKEHGRVAGFGNEVIFFNGAVNGEADISGLKITKIDPLVKANPAVSQGVFVPFKQDYATIGILTGTQGFFYSDQFGGCDFTILKSSKNEWVGSHVYSNVACRNAIATPPKDWNLVHTWKSGPYALKYGMSGSIHVACFVNKASLEFVMVRITGYPPKVSEVIRCETVRL
jgi:hypothetical protein